MQLLQLIDKILCLFKLYNCNDVLMPAFTPLLKQVQLNTCKTSNNIP